VGNSCVKGREVHA